MAFKIYRVNYVEENNIAKITHDSYKYTQIHEVTKQRAHIDKISLSDIFIIIYREYIVYCNL